ncbi:proton-conducting transporter membrane subunit [Pedococcus sp. KACC 23699]|uniref:Proton-conducting transporter membrane subunit n=1 Tax=Pedococcus sp. KACC 23699 TaxID=3149228 RepID=A0AAU7JPX1_9MICO
MNAVATLDWLVLGPVVAPAAGAVVVLVVDAFAPRLSRLHAMLGVVALVLGAALALPTALGSAATPRRSLCLPAPDGACLYEAGPVAGALQVGALLAALVVLLLAWPDRASQERLSTVGAPGGDTAPLRGGPAVLVSLVLAATAGAAGVAAAHDLGSWLVSLELATLPAIALVALRATPDAGRGALALLTTSLVSFAFVVMGAALWLLATAQPVFSGTAAAAALADPERRAVLVLGLLLLVGGVGFKLSLVPFHVWTPQAYSGGTEPVATFLAATSKVAALAALLVVLGPLAAAGAVGAHAATPVLVVVGILAAVSMTVGNLVALVQDDPVRLLAWSTVAQAGWVVLPLSVATTQAGQASSGYLLAYVVATLVAFTVVHLVTRTGAGAGGTGAAGTPAGGAGRGRTLAAYTGLLRRRPVLGGALGLALLSLAGLPPGVLGLVAKVLALRPVVGDGQWVLALVAVANAVLGIAVYLRWFTVLLRDPEPGADAVPTAEGAGGGAGEGWPEELFGGRVPRPALVALLLSGGVLVIASVLPQLVLGLLG